MTDKPFILVSVGTQLPFDRMIRAVLDWYRRTGAARLHVQCGDTGLSAADFGDVPHEDFISSERFAPMFDAADVMVSHAGMGSIISCAEAGKPIIVMPRRADMGEHRNDHQMATAAEMTRLANVTRADSPEDMTAALDTFLAQWRPGAAQDASLPPHATPALIDAVRRFIHGQEDQQ